RKAPRVVVYTGTSKLETRLDQLGVKGYAVGFQRLVHFVMAQLRCVPGDRCHDGVEDDQGRRKGRWIQEVRSLRAVLGVSLFKMDPADMTRMANNLLIINRLII
ncbi:MAG: hypothetical protein ACREXJ_15295, partial [Gammaproteobacteria bacterium]